MKIQEAEGLVKRIAYIFTNEKHSRSPAPPLYNVLLSSTLSVVLPLDRYFRLASIDGWPPPLPP
jgi:hypothetical protein